MQYQPLPKGLKPIQDCAAAAALPEPALVEALLAAGVPLLEMRIGGRTQRYVVKARFDRWLLANVKPVKVAP